MRKFYSFVLMATMLLMGTNAWAVTRTVSEADQLAPAFMAAQNGDVIKLTTGLSVEDQLVLNLENGGKVVLDLTDGDLAMECAFATDNAAILVKKGTLEIIGGEISVAAGAQHVYDLVRVIGDYNTGIDAAVETPYSQVIVAAGAKITSEGFKNALTICENATKVGGLSYANGARIDVYGDVVGEKYGIKVNGSIQKPDPVTASPYVYIHVGANVSTSQSGTGSVAAYSSGYGRWRIEGNCTGSTGLYAKGGDIDIVGNATITSQNSSSTTTVTGKSSGVQAGGSAIVIESNANYPGNISVTIADNATITGDGGYAIEEKIDNAVDGTKVENISIQGGNITGGDAGAIIVEEKTTDGKKVTVAGGNYEGTIQIEGQTTQTVSVEAFVTGSYVVNPENPDGESDYVVTKDETTHPENPTYEVSPNLSKVVTMNAFGFSTFSTDKNRKIKDADADNLKAYTAVYKDNGDLELTLISNRIIPADNGVILWGALDHTYSLDAIEGDYSLSNNNDLRPASAWENRTTTNTFFVLSGNLMYKYVGQNMKEHKAYLEVAAPIHEAPARMRMVIAEPQAVENVATEAVKAQKFIENGQVFIKRGERVYNVQGQIVK